MPLPAAKRAWIVLAVLAVLVALGTGVYLHYSHRAGLRVAGPPALTIEAVTPQQAERTLSVLKELPADAPAVAYIDVEALRKLQVSPLRALLGATGNRLPEDRAYQQFIRETGFDYTRDLDRAAVAFWPATLARTSPTAAGNNRVFAVADGRFEEKKIRTYALKSGKALTRGAQTVYEVPGDPPVSLAFLSPTRIALTSGTRTNELLRTSRSTARDVALQARLDRLAGAPLFAVARTDQLPDSFYANFKNSPQIESLARSVRGVTLAVQSRDGVLQATLDGETTSTSNAFAIATLLEISRVGASLALSDPKTSARMTTEQAAFLDALVKQLKVTRQNRWVRLSLDITPAMLGTSPRPSRQTATRANH